MRVSVIHPRLPRAVGASCFVACALVGCGGATPVSPPSSSDLSHYSIQVSGALTGSTHVDAFPMLINFNQGLDFVGVVDQPDRSGAHAYWAIDGLKAASDLSPRGGSDLLFVRINPLLTGAGVYPNDGCPFRDGFGTACIAVSYSVGRNGNGVGVPIEPYGALAALADDRDTVRVDEVDGDHVKLSIAGPWTWAPTPPAGTPTTYDTVYVSAAFDAYRVR